MPPHPNGLAEKASHVQLPPLASLGAGGPAQRQPSQQRAACSSPGAQHGPLRPYCPSLCLRQAPAAQPLLVAVYLDERSRAELLQR